MKQVNYYKTRDNQQHTSIERAESHALTNAQRIIKNLLDVTCPYLDNTYAIAQKIILHELKSNGESLQSTLQWLRDSQFEED